MSTEETGSLFLKHFDFSSAKRTELAKKGQAMPGGQFPIRNVADLKRAIQAYGRAKNKPAAKAWIIKRAKALDATNLLPEDWVKEGDVKQFDSVETVLEHHGVKGMKWGERRAARKAAKADKRWQDNIYSIKGAIAVHNAVADRMNNGGIARLNSRNDRRVPPGNLNQPGHSSTRAYMRDYERMTERFTADAVTSVHGVSPSGALRARYDSVGQRIVVESTAARHADDTLPTMSFKLDIVDGEVINFANIQETVAQTAVMGERFLNHHGVKGMKWGVRRSRKQLAREAQGQALKRMSDDELRAVVNRMNMEQQYSRLSSGSRNRTAIGVGAGFVGSIAVGVLRSQIQGEANRRIGAALAARAAKAATGR